MAMLSSGRADSLLEMGPTMLMAIPGIEGIQIWLPSLVTWPKASTSS